MPGTSDVGTDDERQIEALRLALVGFIPASAICIPIGQNCNTAWYLRSTGNRACALPFDWIFSSPQIIADCLEDNFRAFLDRGQMVPVNDHVAGHRRYHARLFNHRNPLKDDGVYSYYQRCVDRFSRLFDSNRPLVFLSTMLPERSKRPGWAQGFAPGFSVPENNDPQREYADLLKIIVSRAAPSRLVLMRQITGMATRRVDVTDRTPTMIAVQVESAGLNDGLKYVEEADDAMCKSLYACLCPAERAGVA